ncbi:MAG: phosphate signaling complex protein PhoU [Eubacteriales bacterium]|nr:phosphate signaling complex protein PhoU [Eubacteriales bacterium]
MRVRFDEQLSLLNRELLEMGSLIEQSIRSATQALIRQDVEAANAAIASDHEVDQKEREIEALCLKLLLQQQPVARDLRQISAALKMITDMERIGDQAADISGLVIYLAGAPYLKKLEHLPQMAEAAIRMVTGSLDAYVNKDLELARRVMEMDDIIDDLFDVVKNELIGLIRKNADNGSQAIDLLMIAKYFERIGDHAQNIAEWVEYAITGKHKGEYLA